MGEFCSFNTLITNYLVILPDGYGPKAAWGCAHQPPANNKCIFLGKAVRFTNISKQLVQLNNQIINYLTI